MAYIGCYDASDSVFTISYPPHWTTLLVLVEKVLSMRPWEIVTMKSLSLLVVPQDPSAIVLGLPRTLKLLFLLVVPHDSSAIVLVLPGTLTIMYFRVIKQEVLIFDAVLENV